MNKKALALSNLGSATDLLPVNEIIETAFKADAEKLVEISKYLFAQKGKQIRPILTILTAKLFGLDTQTPALNKIAAGIELIHLATILHDDIIDQSEMRRKQLSAHLKFGLNNTLLTGDFLLVRAFGLCGQLPLEIINATENACVKLTEGEVLETPLYTEDHTVDSALNIARKKTAALFNLACYSGSFIAGANPDSVLKMAKFGDHLGIAFQILDDILDVIALETDLGKRSGIDLRERKPSLVNVLWLNTENKLAKELKNNLQNFDAHEHIQAIKKTDVLQTARNYAKHQIDQAKSILAEVRQNEKNYNSEVDAKLSDLLDFIILRSH